LGGAATLRARARSLGACARRAHPASARWRSRRADRRPRALAARAPALHRERIETGPPPEPNSRRAPVLSRARSATRRALGTGQLAPLAHEPRGEELAGFVAGADERTRSDVGEAHRSAEAVVLVEAFGRDVLAHRRVVLRRSQVLPERQELDARVAQPLHRLHDLLV